MAQLAFVGLGLMGMPMAIRLLDAGHDLAVWNRTTAKTAAPAKRGASVASTPARGRGSRGRDHHGGQPAGAGAGRYVIFASMSGGFWHSEDLVSWAFHATADAIRNEVESTRMPRRLTDSS